MKSKTLGRDSQLSIRMFITMFLLACVYLFFLVVLMQAGASAFTMVVFVGIMLLLQYYLSDKLVLWSMGAEIVSPRQAPELHSMVERLSALANVPKPQVAIVRSGIPNAFATGRSPKHAVVAVTTGLLDRLEKPEVEAVLAHELSHIRHRDVAVMTIASFFATVASLLVRQFLFWGIPMGSRDDDRGGANAALLIYLVAMLVWIVSYFLIRALSRYREYAADRGSAILTGAPSNLASALVKISGIMQRVPERDLREAEAFSAFFIFPAISGNSIAELFSTHPSLENRLAYLRKIERELFGK